MMKRIPTKIPMTMEYQKTTVCMMRDNDCCTQASEIENEDCNNNALNPIVAQSGSNNQIKKVIPHAGDHYQLLPTDKYKMQIKQ